LNQGPDFESPRYGFQSYGFAARRHDHVRWDRPARRVLPGPALFIPGLVIVALEGFQRFSDRSVLLLDYFELEPATRE
jgi:hypothetical protein